MRKVVLALLGALAVTVGTASGAGAHPGQDPPTTTPGTTAPTATTAPAGQPSPGGEAVRGTLFYQDEDGERVPVDGVEITIEDSAGNQVATATSDDEGAFEIPIPGPGSYSATIDEDALPEGGEPAERPGHR